MSAFPVVDAVRRVLFGDDWLGVRSLFVLSTGRTGTQSLTHLLNLSQEVTAFHEPEPLLLEESLEAYAVAMRQPERLERVFLQARKQPLRDAWRAERVYAEMSNRMTYLAPAIARALPNSRFIHLHRHPADVVRSGMRRGWYVNHKLDAYRITPTADDPAFAEWEHWDPFSKTCWYWSAVNDFADGFSQTIPPDRFLAVRFEDLFDGNEAGVQRIFSFLGVVCPSAEELREALSVRHNEQRHGKFPVTEEFSEQHRSVLFAIAGATMSRLGYSLD